MMQKINIKIAKSKEEYLKCLDIRKKVFIEEQKISENVEIDEYENEALHFLVYVNDKAAGTGRFRKKDSFLKFERMAVLKIFRGMNIGSKLLKYMEKIGFEKYPNYLQITHAQKTAVNFYKKNGWIVIGNSFLEADIEHFLMIHFVKDKTYIENLKCLKDDACKDNIKKYLQSFC